MNRILQACQEISSPDTNWCPGTREALAATGGIDLTPVFVVAFLALIVGAAALLVHRLLWGRWLP